MSLTKASIDDRKEEESGGERVAWKQRLEEGTIEFSLRKTAVALKGTLQAHAVRIYGPPYIQSTGG